MKLMHKHTHPTLYGIIRNTITTTITTKNEKCKSIAINHCNQSITTIKPTITTTTTTPQVNT